MFFFHLTCVIKKHSYQKPFIQRLVLQSIQSILNFFFSSPPELKDYLHLIEEESPLLLLQWPLRDCVLALFYLSILSPKCRVVIATCCWGLSIWYLQICLIWISTTLPSFQFLKHIKLLPDSGFLHLLFPLPEGQSPSHRFLLQCQLLGKREVFPDHPI